MITWLEAKNRLKEFAGRGGGCVTAPGLDSFVREVLQYMLFNNANGNQRQFCFHACKGCITVPYELDVPIKIKIDGEVGTVWDRWYEYHSTLTLEERGCFPAARALIEDPNLYPTVYDLPTGGAQVGVSGTCLEAEDAHAIIKGVDTTGREVITFHEGKQIVGEYLRIRKGELRHTTTVFAQVTEVFKTKTNGYVQAYWVRPVFNQKGFLADYSPLEEKPAYRRFKLTTPCHGVQKVSILGRIRLKPAYSDSDLIPFDNLFALSVAGQTVNAMYNNDVQSAVAKDQMVKNLIDNENSYKRPQNGQPVEVFLPLSAGYIVKNIQ